MEIQTTKQFVKDLKRLSNSPNGEADKELAERLILEYISQGIRLPEKHKQHALLGKLKKSISCHVRPDLCLIWEIKDEVVILQRIGSHSELYN